MGSYILENLQLFIAGTGFILMSVVAVGLFVGLQTRLKTANARLNILQCAKDFAQDGMIFYGSKGELLTINNQAAKILIKAGYGQSNIQTIDTLKGVFEKLQTQISAFEHSLLDHFPALDHDPLFRGSLDIPDSTCLAFLCQTDQGGYVALLRDVTEACEKHRAAEDHGLKSHILSEALQACTSGFIIGNARDAECPVVYVNDVFLTLTSTDGDDIIGRRFGSVVTSHFTDRDTQEEIIKILDQKKPGKVQLQIHNGDIAQWYEMRIIPIWDDSDKLDLFIGILSEVTQSKIQEAHLSQTQKLEALGQLAGGVAHDFNNIMSIIDGYARIVKKNIGDNNSAQDYLDRIAESVQRGSALTRQLLTFGRHNVIMESVTDVGQLVKDQRGLLEPLLDASVDLAIQADEGVYIDCDSDSVGQIVINLAVNARDAMPNGGNIIIEVRHLGHETLPFQVSEEQKDSEFGYLRIIDTGKGMDEETKNKIFDPFFTTKEQGQGTGLGLSMVYGIVQQMGGHIDVKTAVNSGTTITLYLPISERKPSEKIVGVSESSAETMFQGYTALIAEDEPDLLELMGTMLEDMGMKVIKAANGDEALIKQEDYEGEIDFLVTDVVMPKLSGVRLAELFESVRPQSKIVFMSGYPANGQLARIQLPEDACLIPKPIQFEKMASILQMLASNQAQEASETLKKYAGQWQTQGDTKH